MLEINIHINRPFKILAILCGSVGLVAVVGLAFSGGLPIGGQMNASVIEVEETIQRERRELAIYERHEELLRYQLQVLEDERSKHIDSWSDRQEQEWLDARENLLELLEDRRVSEEYIRTALAELHESRIRALAASGDESISLRLTWPVVPKEGISAFFHDANYEKQFGIRHEAIDIPVVQGSEIFAAADGVVEVMFEGESGYNYLILSHPGGATVYGHVSEFLVKKGQYVHRGDTIVLSGGRPGSKGAGPLSTGQHLHFEVIRGGRQVNPLDYLPVSELR